ncbi:unnamed protein product [Vicia faba]|uniref:TORTIFOLIA1/SINE1-2 N-terminal domain-containing protein n=1 Tax=Vicia faba TaxID=3906 RepID=A0AAV1ARD9_VICFA|nr:unnamed protein product [Vicia faba]
MIATVLRRLRDLDSVVRSACIDVVAEISSRITRPSFTVAFLRPFMDALTLEQDVNVQIGASLCLAAAIDAAPVPDVESLRRITLPRLGKLLKTDSCKAKAPLLVLIGSVVSVGGASSRGVMSWLVPCVVEFLGSEDWNVRKACAEALGKVSSMEKDLASHHKVMYTTDYLWHTTSILIGKNDEFLKKGSEPVLVIESKGHALHAFVNQKYQGTAYGNGSHSPFTFKNPISLKAGKNEIALLSLTVGLQTAGPFYEFVGAGVTTVKINGLNNKTIDLSSNAWTYKIRVQGEHQRLHLVDGLNNTKWTSTSEAPKGQALTWYKATVDAPPGDEPVGF